VRERARRSSRTRARHTRTRAMVSRARVHGVSSRTARARVAHSAMKIHCQHFFGVVGVEFVDYILDYNTAYVALTR
jgi:hypothetical protein